LTDVVKPSADRQSSRGQHGRLEFGPKTLAKDRSNVDWCGLKKNMLPPSEFFRVLATSRALRDSICARDLLLRAESMPLATHPIPTTFNPEDRVAVFGFEREIQLHLDFLGATNEVEHVFRLLRETLQFTRQTGQRLI